MNDDPGSDDYTEDEYYEELITFTGSCICEHLIEEHGWENCNVEGCKCEAHWEE